MNPKEIFERRRNHPKAPKYDGSQKMREGWLKHFRTENPLSCSKKKDTNPIFSNKDKKQTKRNHLQEGTKKY
jgi:hypothetical protein